MRTSSFLGCVCGVLFVSSLGCVKSVKAGSETRSVGNSGVAIFGDTNRDGTVDERDMAGRSRFAWDNGMLFLPNVDDDNGDGIPDFEDDGVNVGGDAEDIALVKIQLTSDVAGRAASVVVSAEGAGAKKVNMYERTVGEGTGWKNLSIGQALSHVDPEMQIGIEGREFAGVDGWNGRLQLKAMVKDAGGNVIATDTMEARVAPWIMLPNSAKTTDLYIASGPYDSRGGLDMKSDLEKLASDTGSFKVHEYQTGKWQEMWMQDTVEIGYAEMPGSRMHVAFRASRCGDGSCDRFARTILGKNMGYIAVPVRGAAGVGDWDDWFGNLEVTHPVAAWPLGRIYYGKNLNAGWKAFLQAQEVQKPFELDPTWLMIKHVDEIFNFLVSPSGEPIMITTSPEEGGKIYPSEYGPYNKWINGKMEEGIAIAKRELGEPNLKVIRLPMLYSEGGTNDWSSPVNSVHLNGVIAAGNTNGHGPANSLNSTAQGRVIQQRLQDAGFLVRWTNDIAYQPNHGNVHCGTNTRKVPLYQRFWQHLPNM